MKKFLLLLMAFSVTKVFAYEYSTWTADYPNDIPIEHIQSEERYLWYKEVPSDIKYLPKEEFGNRKYDLNDTKESEWSEETFIEPKKYKERTIKERASATIYSKISDIDHLLITDVSGELYLSEITIYDTSLDEYLDYEFEDIYFEQYDYTHLNNCIYDDYTLINIGSNVSIDLGKKYDINVLEITIYYETVGTPYWRLKYTNGIFIPIIEKTSSSYECKKCSMKYHYDNSSNYYFRSHYRQKVYQYKDILYKTYDIKREHTNEYYSNLDGYIKDESKHKTYYRYITSKYILYDIDGNIVTDENYCVKNFCILKTLEEEKPKEEIENPQTIDNISESIIVFVISLIIIIIILIIFSKNVLKCHTNKKSNFVKINSN